MQWNHSALDKSPVNLTAQLCPIKLVLIENEHGTIATEREVRRASLHKNLPQQNTSRRPDINTVAAAGIHIAILVNLDAIRDPIGGHCENTAVGQERLVIDSRDIECVAAFPISFFLPKTDVW